MAKIDWRRAARRLYGVILVCCVITAIFIPARLVVPVCGSMIGAIGLIAIIQSMIRRNNSRHAKPPPDAP